MFPMVLARPCHKKSQQSKCVLLEILRLTTGLYETELCLLKDRCKQIRV